MNNIDKKMKDITILDFKALKISLASSKDILAWSYGEVTKPETINYRTLRPEKDGLFDERIFGPTKDWECYCGKYKRIRYRGIICDKCGVEVTLSRVRRERMGHINLATPVAHVWFFKGSSSPLSLLLDMSQKSLESVIYYASYLVINIDETKKKEALNSFSDYIEKKKQELKQKLNLEEKKVQEEMTQKKKESLSSKSETEQRELIEQEIELTTRQKVTALTERLDLESKKLDEIYDALLKLLRGLRIGGVLSEDEYFKILEYDIPVFFTIRTGAEGLLELLEKIDITNLIATLRKETEKAKGQKYLKLIKRLRLIESIRKAEILPTFMLLSVLPVIPPDLRPMVQLSGGRFATSDLNDLYRRVINRNNRLKHLMSLGAPQIILKNERRMLQEAVDSLIDIAQRSSQITSSPLRSLSDMLRGKQGRFRQNLLGKRVDYSGRSVIVVGPQLTLSQCGLPKEMALEMFKPFVLREVIIRGFAPNIKSAKRFIEKRPPEVFDILEEITKNHPVLLNRAPTLHKLGIQAFYPILIEGSAIALHPCVCAGYNADFDGDQMAVHIPLSKKAQEEAITLMMPKHNLLKPADGGAITLPNKEMAVGIYYLTSIDEASRREDSSRGEAGLPIFKDMQDALLAYSVKAILLREPILVRVEDKNEETTVGRILFNETLPASFGFINKSINASGIKTIITQAITAKTPDEVEKLIDAIKKLGFYGATVSGISVSVFDNEMIKDRREFILEADKKVALIEEDYQKGLITDEERKRLAQDIWLKTTDTIADLTWNNLKSTNVIKLIIDSEGARAGKEQLKQLSAMKGLILDPLGKIVELPIKSNFREGLSIFEYVASARGSRKGLTDSALKTANAGYLTRRLVDCSHDVIIKSEDCGTKEGITLDRDEKNRVAPFLQRILGRILAGNIYSGKTKKIIAKDQEEITLATARKIIDEEVDAVAVRSAITCELEYGICAKCYGWDFSTKKEVEQGVPVGVIAAQSIGEPGTQLTMRVRHFGGVVMSDVTQGLPRVEELFEMRTPKALSPISEFMGKIKLETTDDGYLVTIKSTKIKPAQELEYFIPLTATLNVKDGDEVLPGIQLAQGYIDPKEVLKIKGLIDAQRYVILEAQKVYESQGIAINDKHFEVVLRKMSDKVVVETVGETSLIPGAYITKTKFQDINSEILSQGGEPATARRTILGITKSALYSDSWLSASSFQETTKVLTEAALEGRVDNLIGLKENVIIGRLIPVEGKTSNEV
ncbi:MAG: DNA-directed RNA polymerase subunit beta' [Candidatus Levybacteria bacterium RIFCSPLOWO2_01_FULL_39_24]|nr:MAG: DNA-directed RNA polymerase subunit beta' [Candidatus Levybacteria bacterium RIFCSPHIGHO2_01_FULL_40_16]OGH27840.1 MAG: DNA-directed RNA polymerase subunit beta' [Candidatus Levybacteria bacterium RIFCSPHIGHO2_12_FULL_39_9]OGH45908.1 MAG: DNA-directed RNA polymerase subunit beta' [Candidatus Levybacteria bacterium RIFCSPLOWO2_01_FULL_39_24]